MVIVKSRDTFQLQTSKMLSMIIFLRLETFIATFEHDMLCVECYAIRPQLRQERNERFRISFRDSKTYNYVHKLLFYHYGSEKRKRWQALAATGVLPASSKKQKTRLRQIKATLARQRKRITAPPPDRWPCWAAWRSITSR